MLENILNKLFRRVRKVVYSFPESAVKSKFESFGEGSSICYPFMISHEELIKIGKNTTILEGARMQVYPERTEKKGHINIGANSFIGYRVCLLAGEDITIEDNVTMASNICIVSENHSFNPESEVPYGKQPLKCAPVKIGQGCWIGEAVTILPGVEIGAKCVIGGGSVVTKSIPAYSLAVGNPARVIKKYSFESHEWVKV